MDPTKKARTDARLLWHYSKGVHFRSIVDDGCLRPATVGVVPPERPAVWFSGRQVWEPTVAMAEPMASFAARMGGLIRIGVQADVAPHNWTAFRRLSGARREVVRGLTRGARSVGANPDDWRVSFDPVPRERWAAVEVWDAGAWVRVGEPGVVTR